jgi:hypothetical protein
MAKTSIALPWREQWEREVFSFPSSRFNDQVDPSVGRFHGFSEFSVQDWRMRRSTGS